MSKPLFDPFGEPVPAAERSLASDRTTKWLKSAGTGLFWVLVVAIVLARAVYFEPGNFSFERAMAWIQGLMAVFQGSSV
jgi:type IV secretory pathway VirB2 component (pilin)